MEIRRQVIHASGVLVVPIILLYDKAIGIAVVGGIAVIALFLSLYSSDRERFKRRLIILEQLYWLEEKLAHMINRHSRSKEFPVQGALMFFVGAFIAVYLFHPLSAAAGIAVLALGDSASTLVGKYYGSHKLPWNRDKSFEGSATFFVFALFPLYFLAPQNALLVAAVATAVEMIPNSFIDDNITIPNVVAALVHFL